MNTTIMNLESFLEGSKIINNIEDPYSFYLEVGNIRYKYYYKSITNGIGELEYHGFYHI